MYGNGGNGRSSSSSLVKLVPAGDTPSVLAVVIDAGLD
jgi:hypothetical protein